MKQKQLLRTLLAAVCLLVGTSAWADAGDKITNLNLIFNGSTSGNLTYVLGTGEIANSNGTGQYWTPGVAVDTENSRLKLANGNLTFNLANTSQMGEKDIVTISYDVALGYSTKDANRDFQFIVKNNEGTAIITETYNSRNSDRHSSTLGFSRDAMYNPGDANTDWANKIHFEIVLNYETKKISASCECATATNKSQIISAFDMNDEQQKYIGSIYLSAGNMNAMDHANLLANLKVITTKGDYSTTKTITYKYEDNNGEDITELALSKGATASATPDNGSTYTPVYPTSFVDDDWTYDYTYVSGGEQITVTDDETITIVYNKTNHPITDVVVNYTDGLNIFKTDNIATDYPEGKSIGFALRKYVLDSTNGVLYQTPNALGAWESTAAAATLTENVTPTDIANVVFFAEGEEIDTKSGTGSTTAASRQSVGRFSADGKICTLGAGQYRFYAVMHCGNGSDYTQVHGQMYVKAGETTIGNKDVMQRGNNQNLDFNFILKEEKDIYVQYSGGSSSGIDYIYIQKIGDAEVPANVTSAGWATLYTPYALDFSSLSEDLTAYTASVSDGSVTLTKVQTVPANSGVVLKGKAKEYSIPVIASSKTEKGDLQGATTALAYEDFEANNSYYVLATAADNSGDVQFRKVTSGTIAEGKAYLKIANGNTGGGAKALSVMFANDPTGIATVNASEAVQPAKRIVNGKLVIEKNGKRYNAAGAEF